MNSIYKLINNREYYNGYEGEEEVIIFLPSEPSVNIHFWIGYLDDILENADLAGNGWSGLTRDYHQMEGAFSADPNPGECFDPEEYLRDLSQYNNTGFKLSESKEVLKLITQLLTYALSVKSFVKIRID